MARRSLWLSELWLTRRNFLGGLAATLSACDSDEHPVPGANKPDGGDGGGVVAPDGGVVADAGLASELPWSAWREIKEAVGKSPDCLQAQADLLVSEKDPDAIFRFVRDRILTYPSRALQPLTTSARWGTRATLRGGGGTPRERAELLAELYRKAGLSAEVVVGWRDGLLADDAGLWASYTRVPDRALDPQITIARLTELIGELGGTAPAPPTLVDDGGTASGALADQLLAALPATFVNDVTPFLPALPKDVYIPLVRVTVGGQDKYANPLHPGAAFGDALATNIGVIDPMDAPLGVSIALSVSTSDGPTKRTVVASADYLASDVAGRQVVVRFSPLEDARALAKQTLGGVTTFVPLIAVTGLDLLPADADKLTHTGTVVTVGGDFILAEQGKPVTVNGIAVTPAASNDALAATITTISVTALPTTFPQVELRVVCSDAAGKPVNGLAPSALQVTDAGGRVGFLMRQNTSTAPRVAFLLDQTLSQPAAFLDPIKRQALGVAIGQVLFTALPGALVQVTALSGPSLTPDGYKATDAQGLGAAFGTSFGTSQPIYTDVAAALGTSPQLVVLFSDGVVTETAGEVSVARGLLARGIPVITVSTSVDPTTIDAATMQELAAITGGTNIDGGDFSSTAPVFTALKTAFDKLASEPVALTYTAISLDPGQHEVVVSTQKGVSGKTTYTVPAPSAISRPRAVAGIYLSVKVGPREVVRTLAGWNAVAPPAAGESIPQSLLDEVRGLLLGTTLVSFEAGAPSAATFLSDALGGALALRPASDAARAGDLDGLSAAVASGSPGGLHRLSFLHAPPIPSKDALSFEQGLRAVLLVAAPRFDGPGVSSSDVLGLSDVTTLAPDPTTAVRATLAASARVAIAEAAVYDQATVTLLAGKKLVVVLPNMVAPDQLTFAPAGERAAWSEALAPYAARINLVPDGGGTVAFFSVDPRSGDVLAVLSNGSGGGKSPAAQNAAFDDAFFTILQLFLAILEIPGLGFVLAFGKFVVAVANLVSSCFEGNPLAGDPLGDLVGDLADGGIGHIGKGIGGAVHAGTDAYGKIGDGYDAYNAGKTLLGK